MKTRIRGTNKIVEVEESHSYDGKIGYISKANQFYYPDELDFDLTNPEAGVTIDKDEYEELCKYRRYCSNWAHGLVKCPHCGEFNPKGYICANCGKGC